MDFVAVIEQAKTLLQSKGRVTYRVLKRQFALDDESLEDLKEQLIEAEELAVEKDGKMLVWTGDGQAASPPSNGLSQAQAPAKVHYLEVSRSLSPYNAEQVSSKVQDRKALTTLTESRPLQLTKLTGRSSSSARQSIESSFFHPRFAFQ